MPKTTPCNSGKFIFPNYQEVFKPKTVVLTDDLTVALKTYKNLFKNSIVHIVTPVGKIKQNQEILSQ